MEVLNKYGLMWWEVFYQCYVAVPGTNTSDNPLDHRLAKESTRDMILRYRNNPSVIAWCGANESLPDSDLYFALKDQIAEVRHNQNIPRFHCHLVGLGKAKSIRKI